MPRTIEMSDREWRRLRVFLRSRLGLMEPMTDDEMEERAISYLMQKADERFTDFSESYKRARDVENHYHEAANNG